MAPIKSTDTRRAAGFIPAVRPAGINPAARLVIIPFLTLCLAAAPGGDEWKYDVVHLKSGEALSGLVVERDAKHVYIRKVVRKPGAPTLIFSDDLKRGDIDHIDLLD